MNKLSGFIFALLTVFLLISSCSDQNIEKGIFADRDIFFLPDSENVIIAELLNKKINILGHLDFPPETVVTMDEQGWVSGVIRYHNDWFKRDTINVLIAKLNSKFEPIYYRQIDIDNATIVTHDNHDSKLFFGGYTGKGRNKNAVAYVVDLNSDEFLPESIPIPDDISCYGIDDFMFYDY